MKKVFNPEKKYWSSLIKRPLYSLDSVKDIVDKIFTNVELYGDKSLIEYTNKFDKVDLNNLIVSEKKINNSENLIDDNLKESIKVAFNNIYKLDSQVKKIFYKQEKIGSERRRKNVRKLTLRRENLALLCITAQHGE